jgi:hypothetical protein
MKNIHKQIWFISWLNADGVVSSYTHYIDREAGRKNLKYKVVEIVGDRVWHPIYEKIKS